MRNALLVLLLAASPVFSQTAKPAADPATAPSTALESAWNRGDGAAWGAAFWPDADAVNVFGSALHGGDTLGLRHAEVFAGRMKGTKMTASTLGVRHLSPDAAVVDTIEAIDIPDTATVPGKTLRVYATLVVERRAGVWKIAHMQNTSIEPPPPGH